MSTTAKPRVIWPNPPTPHAILVRSTRSGAEREVRVGPRALLTLDEASALLQRPREQVARAIRGGFLRPVRRGRRRYVTMQACAAFVREELADLAVARARTQRNGSRVPASRVFAEAGV